MTRMNNRSSKRFSASGLQDVLVPVLLVVLTVVLIAVIMLVVLTMISGAPT